MVNIDRRDILSRIVALGVAPQLQKSFLAASILFAFTGAGHAQSPNTVTLTYDNGDRISGEFVELAQGAIRLQTLMGAVTVPLAEVSCDGAACPSGATAQSRLCRKVLAIVR